MSNIKITTLNIQSNMSKGYQIKMLSCHPNTIHVFTSLKLFEAHHSNAKIKKGKFPHAKNEVLQFLVEDSHQRGELTQIFSQ